MKFWRFSSSTLALLIMLPVVAAAQDSVPLAHHVSANVLVQASGRTLFAEPPLVPPVTAAKPPLDSPAATTGSWKLR
jgi:hypothetical protein